MRPLVVLLVGLALVLTTAGACGPTTAPPEQAPGAPPGVQLVPQMNPNNGTQADSYTYCLAGSQLRVFVSKDGHGRNINNVVNVHDLNNYDPYRCPSP